MSVDFAHVMLRSCLYDKQKIPLRAVDSVVCGVQSSIIKDSVLQGCETPPFSTSEGRSTSVRAAEIMGVAVVDGPVAQRENRGLINLKDESLNPELPQLRYFINLQYIVVIICRYYVAQQSAHYPELMEHFYQRWSFTQ